MQVTKVPAVKGWWEKPGFKDWFMNREEARETLEYLFLRSLRVIEDVFDDPNAQANAKVQMVKVLAELANKFPSKHAIKYADEDINRMDKNQLEAYLKRQGVVIKEEKIIEVGNDKGDFSSEKDKKTD